jgi:TRAP-type C4-dicarboxylate transport system permease small subunit
MPAGASPVVLKAPIPGGEGSRQTHLFMKEEGASSTNRVEETPEAARKQPEPDLSEYRIEDWATLGLFWFLAIVVFLQFFTRYALNDSLAWTEEIARYLLTCVAFLGGSLAVRRHTHIHVEFMYLYFPRGLARVLSPLVDFIRVAFFGYGTWLCWKVTLIMQTQPMVVVDWPMSIIYGICTLGFALMTLRAVQVAVRNWRTGSSVLLRVQEEGRHQ